MSRWKLSLAVVLFASTVVAADLAEKWQKRITDAEANYTAAIAKADNARFYAIQKANTDRLTILKKAMSDATKAGDFDAASALKEKVTLAEKDGTSRPKPKNVVKFGGHEYAIIEEKATWHVAKRRCEEMGGHLAVLNTDQEADAIAKLIFGGKQTAWVGATDEVEEGKWFWVTGSAVEDFVMKNGLFDNSGDEGQHYLCLTGDKWDDGGNSRRAFVCEWD